MANAGSIPAHTGKPAARPRRPCSTGVYPRPHGEALARDVVALAGSGLSPPTRGSPRQAAVRIPGAGSIPAHTGKPPTKTGGRAGRRVYPRPHGEADRLKKLMIDAGGLSPPTRGSRPCEQRAAHRLGSIPAHTGKPIPTATKLGTFRVYPRPHGEALEAVATTNADLGLSPPTRGSRRQDGERARLRRSIPAHTGKPRCVATARRMSWVYPRPHGEASVIASSIALFSGLSPPTRGSLRQEVEDELKVWSIPAHTGKPCSATRCGSIRRVYPRPHGEAAMRSATASCRSGLSPPTRGSRRFVAATLVLVRSIPAHTGKPLRPSAISDAHEVYPRPHGEARSRFALHRTPPGLSPPTRGSHGQDDPVDVGLRSIPAHTGKPSRASRTARNVRVYPRPHGEAPAGAGRRIGDRGLSPPTRGSR